MRRTQAGMLPMLLLVWAMLPVPSEGQNLSAYVAKRQAPIPLSQQRIASSVRTTAQMIRQHGASMASTLTRTTRLSQNGEMAVSIYLYRFTPENVDALQQHGAQILQTSEPFRLVHAWVPADALDPIALLPFVRWIGPTSYGVLRTGSVTSKGDTVMRADTARASFNVDGSGVRVGIVSDSLRSVGLQNSIASEDLPPDVQIVNGQDGSGISGTADEGRAMAEIIHDLAPGAKLLFHSGFGSNLEMRNAIRALTNAGANIIVDDIGFLNEPVFEDGLVAQAVQDAIDDGVVYVTATGNDADQHYNATYSEFDPTDGDPAINLHDFGGGDTTMSITIEQFGFFVAILQWPNPFDGSDNTEDFDLLVFDASGSVALFNTSNICNTPGLSGDCASTDRQSSTNALPLEQVFVSNNTSSPVTVTLVINRFFTSTGADVPLAINFDGDFSIGEQHNVASGSIYGHPCVRDALAVGAINANDNGFDTIEEFSSRGPCEIFFPQKETRIKPDLAAADGVRTSLPTFSPFFFGTSAAAPHVAAVAALLMDAAGGPGVLSGTQIVNIMRQAAVDRGVSGRDNTFGYGVADAFLAVQALLSNLGTLPRSGSGGGGGGCSILPPGEMGSAPLEALGNLFLPVIVLVILGIWRRHRARD